MLGLSRRLEELRHGRKPLRALEYRALEWLGPEGLLELGLRLGPYGGGLNPLRKGLSLEQLRQQVHGVDLGPLRPCLPERLGHRDKRIQLAPAPLLERLERLRKAFPQNHTPTRGGELLLIGRRHVRDNNSWIHNLPLLVKGRPRCTLMVHPEDARRLGLAEGGEALVTSRVGQVKVPVSVTDEVMPGVVSLPHGYGHGRQGVRLSVASQHAGVSLNDLTDEQALDELCGNAAFSGVLVRVQPAGQALATP